MTFKLSVFAVLSICVVICTGTPSGRDESDGRLPRHVKPIHYTLEVAPNIYLSGPPFPFTGHVEIIIECIEAANWVTLNAKGLAITNPTVIVDPNTPVPSPSPVFLSFSLNEAADFLTLQFVNQMVVGATYILKMDFNGTLVPPTSRGIYYDYYTSDSGTTKYIVATQLESIFARQLFPCFDEPDMKATFGVTVLRQEPLISLSNMNKLRTDVRADSWLADVYADSPIMSTYLVCIIVGDFVYVEAEWQNVTNYPVRIYARPEMAGNLAYAAKVAPKLQAWLEKETGIPYTLPKMDHIALPSKGGAMENWGLITYGDPYLCINPETSDATGILTVATIVAHELSHMWYGNLVTAKWWNDIWLNEGFATNFNYFPTEVLGWAASELQQGDERRGTQIFLDIDQGNTSDPIRKVVNTVWEAPSSFSGSTYPKGGAMVRMMRSFLTNQTFAKGLTNYLNKYSYSAATTDDLWAELTAQAATDDITRPDGSALDVKSIMDAWLNQMGFPLLTVSRNGDGTATVRVERFLSPNGQSPDIPSDYNYQWTIPVTVGTASKWDTTPSAWIELGQTEATLSGIPTSGWWLINLNQEYFYRVNYDNNTMADIVSQLVTEHTIIPPETRCALIDDSFSVARVLRLAATWAMETTRYLGSEMTYNPWMATLKHSLYNDRLLRQFLWHSSFRTYMTDLIVPVYASLGWNYDDSETVSQQLLRRSIVKTACFFGWPECQQVARTQYSTYKANPDVNSVNPNNLPTVLCVGVGEGTSSDWSMVFQQYQNRRATPFFEERYAYLFGMACTSDSAWVDIYLNYIIRGEQIATRDQNQALRYLVQNSMGLAAVWTYFDNSWNTVPSTISKFTILRNIVSTFSTAEEDAKFNNFVAKYPPQTDSQLASYRGTQLIMTQNMEWVNANEASLQDWLAAANAQKTTSTLGAMLPASPIDFEFELEFE